MQQPNLCTDMVCLKHFSHIISETESCHCNWSLTVKRITTYFPEPDQSIFTTPFFL